MCVHRWMHVIASNLESKGNFILNTTKALWNLTFILHTFQYIANYGHFTIITMLNSFTARCLD